MVEATAAAGRLRAPIFERTGLAGNATWIFALKEIQRCDAMFMLPYDVGILS